MCTDWETKRPANGQITWGLAPQNPEYEDLGRVAELVRFRQEFLVIPRNVRTETVATFGQNAKSMVSGVFVHRRVESKLEKPPDSSIVVSLCFQMCTTSAAWYVTSSWCRLICISPRYVAS